VDINTNTGVNTVTNNFLTANGNPGFANTTATDPTNALLPDLSVSASSPVVGAGIPLTTANGAGSNTMTLIVNDAMFFQDGTWGAAMTHGVTLFPDWISIGTTSNPVQIASTNYSTNTITLAVPMTWVSGSSIWLYKNSSGQRVLYGTASDIGAFQVVR
jgi:hypothetical protein